MECSAEMQTKNFNSGFCIRIANRVLVEKVEEGFNLVLSPLSFGLMLNLVAAGSKGHTLEQMLTHLGSKRIEELNLVSKQIGDVILYKGENLIGGPHVSIANSVWVDQRFGLKASFEEIVRDVYKGKAKAVDLANQANQVEQEINFWVENETRGLIRDLLHPGSLDNDTALVLVNAIYFKGEWDRKFDKSKTTTRDFHLLDRKVVQVPYMTSNRHEKHRYGSSEGYKILSIPYQNGQDQRRFSMYFFLPDGINGLPKMFQIIVSETGFLTQDFALRDQDFPEFWIPRFKFSFEFEASKCIQEMGLDLPFRCVGELTEMVDSCVGNRFCISKVFHKSFIEVNEDGTEAAASTAPRARLISNRRYKPTFVADHPFMFVIREESSKIVFFVAAVLNPLVDA